MGIEVLVADSNRQARCRHIYRPKKNGNTGLKQYTLYTVGDLFLIPPQVLYAASVRVSPFLPPFFPIHRFKLNTF